MGKLLFGVLTSCCLSVLVLTNGCSKPKSPNAETFQAIPASGNKQWEYLIISFGKTYFSDPNEQPESKIRGLSKLLSYSEPGLSTSEISALGKVTSQEAMAAEKNLDTLGKFGWELVGIVGVIGGDQQMVLKRVYDAEQSKTEANVIRAEGERLLKSQQDAAAELARAELIDLDALEKANAINDTRRTEEARLRTAIETVNNYPFTEIKVVSSASQPADSGLVAEVVLDGNARLLKEGKNYRTSEAEALAKEAALAIFNAASLKPIGSDPFYMSYLREVRINVSVKVSNEKTSKTVATASVGGKWPERTKS